MDQEIEEAVRFCTACQNFRNAPPSQKGNDYFLVSIDTNSKWIEVQHMSFTATERAINELCLIFAICGLPEEVVSDN